MDVPTVDTVAMARGRLRLLLSQRLMLRPAMGMVATEAMDALMEAMDIHTVDTVAMARGRLILVTDMVAMEAMAALMGVTEAMVDTVSTAMESRMYIVNQSLDW